MSTGYGCKSVLTAQAPGNAYHNPTYGWFRVTFSVARDDLLVGLGKIEALLNLKVIT
jgi:1-aminocyclopropane-1-carboxylate synthase